MTDRRKSIFFPQVSLSSSGRPAQGPGVGIIEELVYWTPFWSFTSISSTSFFSTLHCFSGATDESLCSGITWIFIFSSAHDAQAGPVLSRPAAGSGGADGLWRCAWIRTAITLTKKWQVIVLRRDYSWYLRLHGLERMEEKQRVWRGLVIARKVSLQLRTARNTC